MDNSIMITYPSGGTDQLKVLYTIEQSEDLQTINCCVDGKSFPLWLQLRKFSILSVEKKGSYTTLFNEINNSKNMATSLFIDFVYSSIMSLERYKYS